jgi:hypothetical protein
MGAWGHQTFENDDACDWLCELEDAEDSSVLADTFDTIPKEADEYVEAPEASMALAAAEVVAALLGRPAAKLPEEVTAWLARQHGVKPAPVKKAVRATRRVLANSELRELWEESEDFPKWQAAVEDLLKRLSSPLA